MTQTVASLRKFRMENGLSLDEVSAHLGVHKTTVMRIETGELPADADMVERIIGFTGGAVSESDMHAIRLAWLKEHRPEKFAAPERAA